MAVGGPEACGAELFNQLRGEFRGGPARRHRSSPEGGGFFFRRGAAEAIADDPQQAGPPLGKTPHVAL